MVAMVNMAPCCVLAVPSTLSPPVSSSIRLCLLFHDADFLLSACRPICKLLLLCPILLPPLFQSSPSFLHATVAPVQAPDRPERRAEQHNLQWILAADWDNHEAQHRDLKIPAGTCTDAQRCEERAIYHP